MSERIIDAYMTNLVEYNEGELGGPLSLPATTEDVQAVLMKAGVDGKVYKEFFIPDCCYDFIPALRTTTIWGATISTMRHTGGTCGWKKAAALSMAVTSATPGTA